MTNPGSHMTNNSSNPTGPRPKTWLLAKSRQWHKWGGLVAGAFILVTCASGILLNYKQPIFNALGLEQRPFKPGNADGEKVKPSSELKITTAKGLAAVPVSLERALELAGSEWGDVTLDRIELKGERGELIYKLKKKGGPELWVNAATGAKFTKGEYEKIGKADAEGRPMRRTDWGKILIDLHTGKIGGEPGKAVMSLAALMLLFLTLSGVYMWLKPLLIRRVNKQARLSKTTCTGKSAKSSLGVRPPEEELIEA